MSTSPRDIRIESYDYPLPDRLIATHPLAQRDACKLLVRHPDGTITDHIFSDIPGLLPDGAYLVYNNTRVINARLRFHKGADNSGSLIEIFCLDPEQPRDYAQNFASTQSCAWKCFVGNSKRWKSGLLTMPVDIDGTTVTLSAERKSKDGAASIVEFSWDNKRVTFAQIIAAAGEIPIPPYLNRATEPSDLTDYQTVYSHIDGSVAAPTAGLHFTDPVLDEISRRGIKRRELTLHVGAGTFQPVKSDTIGDHPMHSEFIAVPRTLIDELATTDNPIIAVGTTSVRTLESLYHIGCLISQGLWTGEVPQWYPYSPDHPNLPAAEALKAVSQHLKHTETDTLIASTRIIIVPGYNYKIVSGMVTNFHQPRSTLLLLVSAFVDGLWEPIYHHALKSGYRFLSYGDASLLLGRNLPN